MQIKGITYTGDGADNRSITGVGFQPDVVFVKRESAATNTQAPMLTTTMGADNSKPLVSAIAPTTDRIQALEADGFQVGTHAAVNANAVVYHALCLKAHANDLQVASYTGNGVDDRSITGVGFQPDLVIILSGGANAACFTTVEHTVGETSMFDDVSNFTNAIQALEADGFQVGTDARVNANTTTYYYVAVKQIAGFMKILEYTGNATDNRSITGVGFDPDHSLTKAASQETPWHPLTIGKTTDNSVFIKGLVAAADVIQQLITDGMQVGTNIHANGNTVVYQSWHFLEGNSQAGGAAFDLDRIERHTWRGIGRGILRGMG